MPDQQVDLYSLGRSFGTDNIIIAAAQTNTQKILKSTRPRGIIMIG